MNLLMASLAIKPLQSAPFGVRDVRTHGQQLIDEQGKQNEVVAVRHDKASRLLLLLVGLVIPPFGLSHEELQAEKDDCPGRDSCQIDGGVLLKTVLRHED